MTQVKWNGQYLALRADLVSSLASLSSPKLFLPVDVLIKMAIKHIPDFEYTNTVRSKIRELMAEVDIKATLGKYSTSFERPPTVEVPKEQWPAIIENGARSLISHMIEHDATEHGMGRESLKAHLVIWPDIAEFNAQFTEAMKARGYRLHMTRSRVYVRKIVVANVKPVYCKHTVISLLDILTKPTLTIKRRWSKGFSHSVSVDDDVALFLDAEINDECGIGVDRIIIERGEVLLVNAAALEILQDSARDAHKELVVKSLV